MIPDLYNTPWLIEQAYFDLMLAIAERGEVTEALIRRAKGEPREPEHTAVADTPGERIEGTRIYARDGVGIMHVRGPIIRHADLFSQLSDGAVSIESLSRDLASAVQMPGIKAILLNIDSPGGEVNGISEFAAKVRAADKVKPVTAYTGGMAASAAYWLASSAGQFVMHESASSGSIGVVHRRVDRKGMEERLGIRSIETASSQSPKKRLDPDSEEGKADIQARVDELYDLFETAVASYRGVDKSKVRSDFGQGGMLLGRKAQRAGMADRIGTFEGVLRDLKRGRPRPSPAPATSTGGSTMSWREKFFGLAEKGTEEELEAAAKALEGNPAPKAEKSTIRNAVDVAAENEQLRALREMNEALSRQNATLQAESSVDRLIAAGKATAAERAMLVQSFALAAMDDAAHAVASGGKSRVDMLNEAFGARSKSILTEEHLHSQPPAGSRQINGSDPGIEPPSAEQDNKAREEAKASVGRTHRSVNGAK
jgi:capsid assembly protease